MAEEADAFLDSALELAWDRLAEKEALLEAFLGLPEALMEGVEAPRFSRCGGMGFLGRSFLYLKPASDGEPYCIAAAWCSGWLVGWVRLSLTCWCQACKGVTWHPWRRR